MWSSPTAQAVVLEDDLAGDAEEQDEQRELHATWRPDPTKSRKWPSGRVTVPLGRFSPDGKGGGVLHLREPILRRGFRPKTSVRKSRLGAP